MLGAEQTRLLVLLLIYTLNDDQTSAEQVVYPKLANHAT